MADIRTSDRSSDRTADRAADLLYDTAATLRLLDAELGELAPRRTAAAAASATTTDRFAHTSETLDDVSSATGKAALDIMHALERALANVDELETDAVIADADRGRAIRRAVRDELFAVIGHMQFQDITAQQITHVQSLLADLNEAG